MAAQQQRGETPLSHCVADTDKRFVDLETKVAYQEKLLADLNEVLLQRGEQVDLLVKRLEKLERSLRGESPEGIDGQDRPPHY